GEQPEAAFGDLVRRAAEAEGDVELKVADDLSAFFEAPQDLVGGAPARCLHKALDRALVAALAGDLRLLLVGIVALHGFEVLAEEFVVMEIAFDEIALVLSRLLLAGSEVGAADDELGQHHLRRFGAVVFAVEFAAALNV